MNASILDFHPNPNGPLVNRICGSIVPNDLDGVVRAVLGCQGDFSSDQQTSDVGAFEKY